MKRLPWNRIGWRNLLRLVRRATRNRDDAEDLLHTAFVKLSEYGKAAEIRNLAAFLVRTAVNLAVDEQRHRHVRNENFEPNLARDFQISRATCFMINLAHWRAAGARSKTLLCCNCEGNGQAIVIVQRRRAR